MLHALILLIDLILDAICIRLFFTANKPRAQEDSIFCYDNGSPPKFLSQGISTVVLTRSGVSAAKETPAAKTS